MLHLNPTLVWMTFQIFCLPWVEDSTNQLDKRKTSLNPKTIHSWIQTCLAPQFLMFWL
jgi:hypothetical protein